MQIFKSPNYNKERKKTDIRRNDLNALELNAPISCLKLVEVVHWLKPKKAVWWDNIYPSMIKYCREPRMLL